MNGPSAPPASLPQPPSAGKAKLFGILGICSHVLCLLGAPFAILFGILALVRHARAKREQADFPDAYARPHATGFVTGLVALGLLVMTLPMTGIVSAIAIPALLGQREKAKARAVEANLQAAETRLQRARRELQARGVEPSRVPGDAVDALLADPAFQPPRMRNPYAPEGPAFVKGPEPAGQGCIALEPGQAWKKEDSTEGPRPGVVMRTLLQRAGQERRIERLVAFD